MGFIGLVLFILLMWFFGKESDKMFGSPMPGVIGAVVVCVVLSLLVSSRR